MKQGNRSAKINNYGNLAHRDNRGAITVLYGMVDAVMREREA